MTESFQGRRPEVAESAFIHPSAVLIGDIAVGERASIWANATLRGDICSIRIGDESNIQDNCCLHVDPGLPLEVGERVVVGHSVTLHACIVEDDCLIGMGSTVLSGAKIGRGTLIAAGSLVLEGAEIPPNSIVMGSPAKVRRETTEAERERMRKNAQNYVDLSRTYLKESS